jgi:hypothetical protein
LAALEGEVVILAAFGAPDQGHQRCPPLTPPINNKTHASGVSITANPRQYHFETTMKSDQNPSGADATHIKAHTIHILIAEDAAANHGAKY